MAMGAASEERHGRQHYGRDGYPYHECAQAVSWCALSAAVAWKLEEVIAAPNTAPHEWQSSYPRDAYAGYGKPVRNSPDLQRILALPRRALEMDGTARAEAIIDIETEKYSLGSVSEASSTSCKCATLNPERHEAEGCITRLRLVQAMALREIAIVGGLLGPIGVGHGKTLIDLLAPFAFARHAQAIGVPNAGEILCVLLVPPGLIKQLSDDYTYIGQHFRMPTIVFQGSPHLDQKQPHGPRLQVMPYSRLSLKDATSWLNVVQPHAIIADECHKLRCQTTSTTSRVMRYFDEHRATRLAAWSGSLTSKSIRDYSHLSALALKGGSPLPINYEDVEDWARAIDPSRDPADPGPLLYGLIETGCCKPGETLYTGIRRRLVETLGVVSTATPSFDCDLEINERTAPKMPERIISTPAGDATLAEHIQRALGFVRPDGEELVTAMQAVECAITISCGFYYRWIYPKHSFPRDTMLVLDWLDARKEWHRELRQKLKRREEHLDSPLLCMHAAQRALGVRPQHKGLPNWQSKTYPVWHEIKDKVKYESEAVRIDDYLVQDAAAWATDHNGIIWYEHNAFGEWLAELTKLPRFGAGKDAKLALLGDAARGIKGELGDRSVICSITSIGTGTNGLQYVFADQLFQVPAADPAQWEQALGRVHRPGQKRDVVRAWFYMLIPSMRKHVRAALRAALYAGGTLLGEQKLRSGFDLDLAGKLEDEESDED